MSMISNISVDECYGVAPLSGDIKSRASFTVKESWFDNYTDTTIFPDIFVPDIWRHLYSDENVQD